MRSKIFIVLCLITFLIMVVGIDIYLKPILISRRNLFLKDEISQGTNTANVLGQHSSSTKSLRPTSPLDTVFADKFNTTYTLAEAGSISKSRSDKWWLSSGGYFYSSSGIGKTISGALPMIDPWRIAYSLSNPLDTAVGYYPQNIFRLVSRSLWKNFTQEAYFKITNDNLTDSPNRNESNGLLLFNRYQDAFNLYYTGIRVDGYAVIKKKIDGVYYTMAYNKIVDGPAYNKDGNPNLLPKNSWIGLKSEVVTNSNGTVSIKLYVDKNESGKWALAAEAIDNGKDFGKDTLLDDGHAGIRTDFMDVEFKDYKIEEINSN